MTTASNQSTLSAEPINRRALLQLGGATAAATLLPRLARGESPKPNWKTAIGLNGFMSSAHDYDKTYPIWEVLDFASRQGFDGVELVSGWPQGGYPAADERGRIRALKRLYDAFGLQIFSIQLGVAEAFDPRADVRKRWVQKFRDRAEFARQAGCDCIGMWPGGPLRDQTIDQAIKRLADSFRQAGRIAEDLGLLPAFEIEPPFVFHTEEHLKRILDQLDGSPVKTIFDPSHFDLMNGSRGKPHEMLQRIGVEHIGYVHLTDCDGTLRGGTSRHLPCGEGHVDIPAALATLRRGGFSGWIMIDQWKIPDPYEASIQGKRAIERALRS
jgi:sugar phosphate isomerase/epimerase